MTLVHNDLECSQCIKHESFQKREFKEDGVTFLTAFRGLTESTEIQETSTDLKIQVRGFQPNVDMINQKLCTNHDAIILR